MKSLAQLVEELKSDRDKSTAEEFVDTLLSGLGCLGSLVGFFWLLKAALERGDLRQGGGALAFALSLVLAHGFSTLYHLERQPDRRKRLKLLDHLAIFILIAGTYTPFALVTLWGPWGWSLLAAEWVLALVGIFLKIRFFDRFRILFPLLYLVMGWLAVLALDPLRWALPPGGFFWVLAGGLSYSLGLVFFAFKRLSFNHAIWHLFVLGGGACHFVAILFYVLPAAP